jgi:hypothetical protein
MMRGQRLNATNLSSIAMPDSREVSVNAFKRIDPATPSLMRITNPRVCEEPAPIEPFLRQNYSVDKGMAVRY